MKKNLLILLVVVAVGFGTVKFLNIKKENAKKAALTAKFAPHIGSAVDAAPSKKNEIGERVYSMHAILPRLVYIFTEAEREISYNFFKDNGINLKSSIEIWDQPRDVDVSGWNHDMGATSLFTYHELLRGGKKLTPVFWFYKKDPRSKCSYSVDIIAKHDSSLTSFKDLAGKSVVSMQSMKRNGPLIRQALLDEKVIVGNFNINSNFDWLSNSIQNGTVDAILNVRRDFPNTPFESPEFGKMDGAKILKHKNLKLVYSKATNIPCDIFFENQLLSEKERTKITDIFKKARDGTPQEKGLLNRLGAFASIDDISPADSERINSALNGYDKSNGLDYSTGITDLKLR